MSYEPTSPLVEIADYRVHFDSIYVAGVPRLLCDEGVFLSFLVVLSATDALAGLYAPSKGTGERFKAFVERYFPEELKLESERLWQFRNAMVHSFNPGPYGLTHHASRAHLTNTLGVPTLNAEDFYAALLTASRHYFSELAASPELQDSFMRRVKATDGGAPQMGTAEIVGVTPNKPVESDA